MSKIKMLQMMAMVSMIMLEMMAMVLLSGPGHLLQEPAALRPEDAGGQQEGVHTHEGYNEAGENDDETDRPFLPADRAMAAKKGEEAEDADHLEQTKARQLGGLQSYDRCCSEPDGANH